MERTNKTRRGKSVVIGMLLLASMGAGLTWMRYTAQAPSTANAHLVSERLITATFDSYAARHIREGSKAIVTFETSAHEKLPGIVQALHSEAGQTRVMITLKETPVGVQLQMPCAVTVDTSVPARTAQPD